MCRSYLKQAITCTIFFSSSVFAAQDYAIRPIPFTQVHFNDAFWAPRLATNNNVTIPYSFKKCEQTGRIDNFAIAGKLKEGKFKGLPFDDSDVYKIIEGAAYSLADNRDPNFEKYIDDVIAKIAAAQEPDGYLYTARTIDPCHPASFASPTRWLNDRGDINGEDSHELYNQGHLYEAAVAYYQATGKRNLLNVAIKSADLVAKVFGPELNQLQIPPGHQEIEIGLVKLYRATGDSKYLNLAKFFLDQRGRHPHPKSFYPPTYFADHKPVIDQNEALGHSVRTSYMLCGMADVAAITGDKAYLAAIDRIWQNVASRKLYLTGGIGGRPEIEGFCSDYDLPNLRAYNETCAAIGNALWNYRMFLLHGDSQYIDVLERTIYNGFLSGVSLSGDKFFYPNPLECDMKYKFNQGSLERQPWFDVSCCPGNVVRFIPSIPGYVYAANESDLYVNLFVSGTADVNISGNNFKITQVTNYPWDGKVKIQIDPAKEKECAVHIRIPGWARNKPVPGDLYSYADKTQSQVCLSANDQAIPIALDKGYVTISRLWKKGDTITLNMSMPVRIVTAKANVIEDANKIAIERGPLVYCIEGVDNGGKILGRSVDKSVSFTVEQNSALRGGINTIKFADSTGQPLTAIPYYAWNHRGANEMAVWLPIKH